MCITMKDNGQALGIRRGLYTRSQTKRFLKYNSFSFTVFKGPPWQYVLINQTVVNRVDSGEHSGLGALFQYKE